MTFLPRPDKYRSAQSEKFGSPPTVGIVVPIYNEIEHLATLLEELRSQDYRWIEICFVDGESTDGSIAFLQRHCAEDARFTFLTNPKRTTASAINLAFAHFKTDIVMRLDAHARYEADVVRASVDALLATGAAGVGAVARLRPGSTLVERAIIAAHKSPIGVGVAQFRREGAEGWVDSIWNGCYWKHIVDQVGALREDLWRAEDNDFNQRVRDAGYGLYLSPAIRASYQPRRRLTALWRQYFSNGIGVGSALFENPGAFSLRHIAPAALVGALVAPTVIALVWPRMLGVTGFLLGAYAFALLAATLIARRSDPGPHLFLLPLAIATIHISYGFGFFLGLFAYVRRRLRA
jgi:succinoglycan biosynthesis protein ExoA